MKEAKNSAPAAPVDSAHAALMSFLMAVGYAEVTELAGRLSEDSARALGETIYQMMHSPRISQERIERTVESLFRSTEQPRVLTYARLYSILARSLGHGSYVEFRLATAANEGYTPVRTRSTARLWLEFFAPAVKGKFLE